MHGLRIVCPRTGADFGLRDVEHEPLQAARCVICGGPLDFYDEVRVFADPTGFVWLTCLDCGIFVKDGAQFTSEQGFVYPCS